MSWQQFLRFFELPTQLSRCLNWEYGATSPLYIIFGPEYVKAGRGEWNDDTLTKNIYKEGGCGAVVAL